MSRFLLEIIGEDTGSTLYLGSTRARLVVLSGTWGGNIAIGSLLVTFDTEDFRTDKTAIVGLGLGKEVLYHLITGGLALAIGTLCLSAVETDKHDDARHGTTHHAQATYSTTKASTDALGHSFVETIKVGKGCHHTLAAAISGHEIIYSALYALI